MSATTDGVELFSYWHDDTKPLCIEIYWKTCWNRNGWEEIKHLMAKAVRLAYLEILEKDLAGVCVRLTDDQEVCSLNNLWRQKNKPTNVLAFPCGDMENDYVLLGDIVLGYETIMLEAKEYKRDFLHHVLHLVVHGLLHLMGYDHIDDKQADVMESLEVSILKKLGIVSPYAMFKK